MSGFLPILNGCKGILTHHKEQVSQNSPPFSLYPRLEVFNRGKLGRESGRKRKMEDFLATVRSISADKNYVQLAEFLNRSNELLAKYAGQIDAAIASLDPDQHTLAFMALL